MTRLAIEYKGRRIWAMVGIIASLFLVCSCNEKADPPPEPFAVYDRIWTEEMDLKEVYLKTSESLKLYVWLGWSSFVNDHLTYYVLNNEATALLTPSEQFAVDKINERSRDLKEYFYANYAPHTQVPHTITTVYARESPRVYADRTLFGKDPGEDLSSFFEYAGGTASFKTVGIDYQIAETKQLQHYPLTEYFSPGTVFPYMFFLQSTRIPEELYQDDDINLSFVFPVLVEHYWSWLLELYERPDAVESFTEMDMTLKANLKDLKVFEN